MIPHPFGKMSSGITEPGLLQNSSNRYLQIGPHLFSETIFPNFFSKFLHFEAHLKMDNILNLIIFLNISEQAIFESFGFAFVGIGCKTPILGEGQRR